jgi:flagellar export protein FliJ
MAFKFPLATVLQVRESIEKREERALQQLMGEIYRVQREIDELANAVAKSYEARELAMRQPIPAADLQAMLQQARATDEKRLQLLGTLHVLEQRRDEQLKIYQAAHRDHEAILSMFQEQRHAYEQEQLRTQQKNLDDIFASRRHLSS